MARFNSTNPSTKTINHAGGEAYSQSTKLELVSILLTSFVADQYYRKSTDTIKRLQTLLDTVDPKFAAQAAIYARTEFGMRSVSHVIAAELATRVYDEPWKVPFYDKIIFRPDDMTEILSYYYALRKAAGLKPTEPNAMKRGFARATKRFDAYQLAKYRGEGKTVSLVDLANVIHPPHSAAIEGLIKGTLKNTNTWEAKLSDAGQKAKTEAEKTALKEKAWRDLLSEGKLPYFALLRNLRNIIEQAPEMVDIAIKQLTNERLIRKSLVLPFRFFTAYSEIASLNNNGIAARKVLRALSDALDLSCANIPTFEGRSLVVVDHSGSMDSINSQFSKATNFEIGALFGVALAKATNADFMYFGDIAKYYQVTHDSIMNQMRYLVVCNNNNIFIQHRASDRASVGHGTNFKAIFKTATQAYDRIFIFSDMQAWIGYYTPKAALAAYKAQYHANPHIFAFDLAGYGTMQFPEPNLYQLAGFSEKIFDILRLLEQDRSALIKKIEEVEL